MSSSLQEKQVVAGISLVGASEENSACALMEYHPSSKRWALMELQLMGPAVQLSSWLRSHSLQRLCWNFPLTRPLCQQCGRGCNTLEMCQNQDYLAIQSAIQQLLAADQRQSQHTPKDYEEERLRSELHENRLQLGRASAQHQLSKAFKRKLRKGFFPYMHRPIDFWIWQNYYDQLLTLFGLSYDSFGTMGLPAYWRIQFHLPLAHLPAQSYESSSALNLIELARQGVVGTAEIKKLQIPHQVQSARAQIVAKIEQKLQIFIYASEVEKIVQDGRCFDAFLLALAATQPSAEIKDSFVVIR